MVLRLGRIFPHPRKPVPPLSASLGHSLRIVVIGSGVTGLCAAAMLSKLGHQVTVLEAHPKLLGGHARSLDINGVRFNAGPQFVWNFVGNPNMAGEKVLRFLDVEECTSFELFNRMCQDKVFIGDDPAIDIPRGLNEFQEVMIDQFPEERPNLSKFFAYIERLFKGTMVLHDEGAYLHGSRQMMRSVLSSRRLSIADKCIIALLHDKTLSEVFDLCGISEKARRVLYAHGGIFAENDRMAVK